MAGYQIFTDATADLSAGLTEGIPPVRVISMQVEIGGSEYIYGPTGNLSWIQRNIRSLAASDLTIAFEALGDRFIP